MNAEAIREHCLLKQGVSESFPFNEHTLVFKYRGKMFLLLSLDEAPPRFTLKCMPALAEELREQYTCVLPGYHMNKKHWNTVICDGSVPAKKIKEWIDHSYSLVAKGLKGISD